MASWTWISLLAVAGVLAYLLLRHRRARSLVMDPVCGMAIVPARAYAIRHGADGPIYLCSQRCAASFDAVPQRYGGVSPHRGAHLAC